MKKTAAIALIILAALLLVVLSVQPLLNSREASRPGGGVGTSGDADQRSAASAKLAVEQAPEVAAPVHPPPQLVELNVYPREINLTTRRDFQSLVVQARFDDGVTRDVTHDSTFVFAEPTLVDFDEQVVHPLLDGETTLTVTYGDQTVESSVTVKNAQVDRPIVERGQEFRPRRQQLAPARVGEWSGLDRLVNGQFDDLVGRAGSQRDGRAEPVARSGTDDPLVRVEPHHGLGAGTFELLACGDVPPRVVITEYVDNAHAFFEDREPAFVNAVLDRLAHALREDGWETQAHEPQG